MLSDRTRHPKKKKQYKKIQKIRGKIIRPCRCFVWKVDRRSLRRFGAEDSIFYIESEIYPFFSFSVPWVLNLGITFFTTKTGLY